MNAGWEFFKQDPRGEWGPKYREAAETFSLADAIVIGDYTDRSQVLKNKNRAETKVALIYAAVAAGRYAEAANALTWLLKPVSYGGRRVATEATEGQLPDPHFMTIVKDIRAMYADRQLFDEHLNVLKLHVQATQQQVGQVMTEELARLLALNAFMLWSDTESSRSKTEARTTARQLRQPWQGLLLQAMATAEADAAASKSGRDASDSIRNPTDVGLPSEKAAGKPATTRPAQTGG